MNFILNIISFITLFPQITLLIQEFVEGNKLLFALEPDPEVECLNETLKAGSLLVRMDKVASHAERTGLLLHEVTALVRFELSLLRVASFEFLVAVRLLALGALGTVFGLHEFATQVCFVVL